MAETVAERKKRERKEKLELQKKKQKRQYLVILVIILALIVGIVYFMTSDFFNVKKVQVTGGEHIVEENKAGVRKLVLGKSIFRVPTGNIKSILSRNPWVKEVKISKDYPDRVVININERKPVAVLSDGISYYTVSGDGHVLEISEKPSQLVQIMDIPLKNLSVGEKINSEEFKQALEIYKSLPQSLKKDVMVISAPSVERIVMYVGGVEVIYGMAEHIEEKNTVLKEILSREGTSVISIDIRVPTNPIVKGEPLSE